MCQEMLTGERPAGLTPSPERTRGRVVTASGSRPEWPPPLRSFFANALALDRRLRPQNAASFHEQLAAALGLGHGATVR
jgi:hypothetical protein